MVLLEFMFFLLGCEWLIFSGSWANPFGHDKQHRFVVVFLSTEVKLIISTTRSIVVVMLVWVFVGVLGYVVNLPLFSFSSFQRLDEGFFWEWRFKERCLCQGNFWILNANNEDCGCCRVVLVFVRWRCWLFFTWCTWHCFLLGALLPMMFGLSCDRHITACQLLKSSGR